MPLLSGRWFLSAVECGGKMLRDVTPDRSWLMLYLCSEKEKLKDVH